MNQDPLQLHRSAIDQIDQQILQLLNQRAEHARAIGVLKGTGSVYRPEREAQVLRRIQENNQGPLAPNAVARLFREIMSECLALERPLTVAYLGPEGTFTQQAALKHFGHAANTQPFPSLRACLQAVEQRHTDYAVIPIENSTEGTVAQSLDLLALTPLKICGEAVLPIHHHLLRHPEAQGEPQNIHAHAQALAQCRHWLDTHYPNIPRISSTSNAEAARQAAENPQIAAIAGTHAAQHYHLNIIHTRIEDQADNTTRFLVLGHESPPPSGKDKTSLIVSGPNRSGTMYHILDPLKRHGVSMTKLESRPSRNGLWEYLFFIDVEGHADTPPLKQALEELHDHTTLLKIIGSYPSAVF